MFAMERVNARVGEFKVICINPAHGRHSGFPDETLSHASMSTLFPANEVDLMFDRYRTCLAMDAAYEYFEILTMADGVLAWRTRLQPLCTPSGTIGVLGSAVLVETQPKTLDSCMCDIQYWTAQAQLKTAHLATLGRHLADPKTPNQDREAMGTLVDHLQAALHTSLDEIDLAAKRSDQTTPPSYDA